MSRSKIEWTDEVWNPTRGCSRVSEGCRHCYAERQAARFAGPGQPYERVIDARGWNGRVELVPEVLDAPLHWRRPRRVFVDSMSDLFHESLSDDAIEQVFAVMAAAPKHRFQVLTKRPERMRAWLSAPRVFDAVRERAWMRYGDAALEIQPLQLAWPLPHVWIGVSVEDQATADARVPVLLDTPAAVRWVSCEPQLGPVDFGAWMPDAGLRTRTTGDWKAAPALNWIVVGGESGPRARPFDVAWARGVVAQCQAARVPVFVKQLGARPRCAHVIPEITGAYEHGAFVRCRTCGFAAPSHRKGGDPEEWPKDLRVREFPR